MKTKKNNILRHFLPAIKKHKKHFILMIISIFSLHILDLIPVFIFRNIIDLLTIYSTENHQEVIYNVFLIALIMVSNWLLEAIFHYNIIQLEIKSMRDLNNYCFQRIQEQSFRYFSNNFTGSLVRKVSRFVRSFEAIIDITFFALSRSLVYIIFALIVFWIEKPIFGLVFLVWTILYISGAYYSSVWKMKFDKKAAKADSKVGALLADSFSNYSTVKIFQQQKWEQNKFGQQVESWRKKTFTSWILSLFIESFQGILVFTLQLCLLFMAISWWKKGEFSAGDFFFFQTYITMIMGQLWNFGREIKNFYQNTAYAQEMAEILNIKSEIQDVPNALDLQVTKGVIEFKNVSFAHENDTPDVLRNFSLKIKAGEKVALVGQSGAGKTTIVKILFRFFDIQKGQILIDKQNITRVSQSSLRNQISLVPQDPNLFHRSIAENIAYGKPEASQTEIESAARQAYADKFIQELGQSYKTMVGERGVKLSGGEKQRIAIARVILENNKILVLDEATSALDSVTEKEIQKAINAVQKNKTTIIIAHRLSTVKKVDRVVVISNKGIIEQGTHKELLKSCGEYAQLWSHQVGGFLADE